MIMTKPIMKNWIDDERCIFEPFFVGGFSYVIGKGEY
jgi:hypothetical protein